VGGIVRAEEIRGKEAALIFCSTVNHEWALRAEQE
jgi:hypothetical protein